MKVERTTVGDVTVLAFSGDFDAFNLGPVADKLDALIAGGSHKLVFNLDGLRFVNSSALGYMIKTNKRLKQAHGELVLAAPSDNFRSTIATLGIDKICRVFATDDEAVAHLRKLPGR